MTEDFSDIVSVFKGGIRICVKAKPNCPRKSKPKIVDIADGKRAVEIAISAIAEDGKANKAITEYIAKEIGIKKNAVSIKTGTTGRIKLVEICADAEFMNKKIYVWLNQL